MLETFLPPDLPLLALATHLRTLLPAGANINFFRVEHDDGRRQIGITYSYGAHRETVMTDEDVLTEADAPEIISGVAAWIEARRFASRWTEDPNEAG